MHFVQALCQGILPNEATYFTWRT